MLRTSLAEPQADQGEDHAPLLRSRETGFESGAGDACMR